MVEKGVLPLVVCLCGRVKHYQEWEMMIISFSDFIKTIMESGNVSLIELLPDKCPTCREKEEEIAIIA